VRHSVIRLCAPPYYLYTLGERLRHIEPLLEELGVPLRVEVVGECGDVFIEIAGRGSAASQTTTFNPLLEIPVFHCTCFC